MSQSIIKSAFTLIINASYEILLIQEGCGEDRELWHLPGGHVDNNETNITAAIRETKEETGFDVEITGKILSKLMNGLEYKHNPAEIKTIYQADIFKAIITGGKIVIDGNEIMNVKWFKLSKLNTIPFRWPWLKDFIEKNYERLA